MIVISTVPTQLFERIRLELSGSLNLSTCYLVLTQVTKFRQITVVTQNKKQFYYKG